MLQNIINLTHLSMQCSLSREICGALFASTLTNRASKVMSDVDSAGCQTSSDCAHQCHLEIFSYSCSTAFAMDLHSLMIKISLTTTPIIRPPIRLPSSTQLGTTQSWVNCSSFIDWTTSLSRFNGNRLM